MLGLGTPAAFQSVWLPLAGRSLGGELKAETGRLSLAGTLEAEQIVLLSPDVEGEIERLQLTVAPWASLRRGRYIIEQLTLHGANLRFAAAEADAAPSDGDSGSADAGNALPRIEIRHGDVGKTTLHFQTADGKVQAGPANLKVEDWVFPEQGDLKLSVPVQWRRTEKPPLGMHAEVTAKLLPRSAESTSPSLEEGESAGFSISVRLDIDAQEDLAWGASKFELQAEGGLAEGGDRVRLESSVATLEEDDAQRLRLEASGMLAPEAALDLKVQAEHLEHTARWTTARALVPILNGARVEGGLQLVGELAAPKIVPDLKLTLGDVEGPLGLHATGALRWQSGEAGPEMLMEPLGLAAMRKGEASGGRLEIRGAARPAGSTELRVTAEALDLLPWLQATGQSTANAQSLEVDGTLTGAITPTETRVDGEWKASLAAPGEDGDVQTVVAVLTPEVKSTDANTEAKLSIRGEADFATRLDLDGTWSASSDPTVPARAELDLRVLDLTPWAQLFQGGEAEASTDEEPEADPETPPAIGSDGESLPPQEIELQIQIGDLRLHDLSVQGGDLRGRLGRAWEMTARDVGVAAGSVAGKVWGGERGGTQEVGWDLQVTGLDSAQLLSALDPGGDARLEGLVDLDTRGEGQGRDLATALDKVNGDFRVEVSGGKAEGLRLQEALVAHLEIPDFNLISFDDLQGDYPIRDGQLLIDDLRVDGTVVQLVATGEVSAKDVDISVNPRLGPDLQGLLPLDLAGRVLGTATDLLALPIVVRVSGPLDQTEISIRPAAPAVLDDLYSGLTDLTQLGEEGGRDVEQDVEGVEQDVERVFDR